MLDIGQRPQPEIKPEDLEPDVSVNSVVVRWVKEFKIDWKNKDHRDLVRAWRERIRKAQEEKALDTYNSKRQAWLLSMRFITAG